jgi:bifunctional non-homologous end joining protein LigD
LSSFGWFILLQKLTKVSFTNLERVLYPQIGVTKAQVIEYYIKMAPRMLPFLKDRPIVLTRYPDGVDEPGFFTKTAPEGTPEWVKTAAFYSERLKRDVVYIVCNDLDTLLWIANIGTIEIHIPLSRIDKSDNPDLVFVDVDPEPPATISDAGKVALLVKQKFDDFGLKSFVKTSGKKGLHVAVPVARQYTFEETRLLVHVVGRMLMREHKLAVSEFSDTKTPGKVFVDYLQNHWGRTMACPYSLRATPDASVSMPLDWNALEKEIKPSEFNIQSVPGLKSEPWKDIFNYPQKLEAKWFEQKS